MPSHQNVWCGKSSVWFQDIFWLRNHRLPASRAICGSDAGVAERVGQPHLVGSRRRAPRGRTACRARAGGPSPRRPAGWCRTRPTCRRPARTCPAATRGPDPLEQLGLLLGDPGVLLRRRAREPQVGVLLGERDDVGERARALAHRLAHRPQPGRVDVRVPDGRDAVGAGVGGRGEHVGQPRRAPRRRVPAMSFTSRWSATSWSAVSTRARRGSPSSIEVTVPSSTSRSCPSASTSGSTATSSARASR